MIKAEYVEIADAIDNNDCYFSVDTFGNRK